MNRRQFLVSGTAIGLLAGCAQPQAQPQTAAEVVKDPQPLTDELGKYASCKYCGMDRRKWHHSRHLIHYDDDYVEGTCSIHCAAVSLALHLDRGPKAVYAADFGATADPRPLVDVDRAVYLIGSKLPGTMSARSKMAFADAAAARAAQAAQGGDLGTFDQALAAAYADMAADTAMIRKRRAERRRKAMEKQGG